MTQIFLVRHGEAEGNLYRRAQGQFDAPLTAQGLRQIETLTERFRDVPIDAAYASDLSRAYQTACACVKAAGLPVTKDARLREQGLGSWENRPWGNLQRESPELMRWFSGDPARWSVPGGESYEALQGRMKAALLELAARHEGQTILCGSHGMAIRSLLADLLGVASADIRAVPHADNTAVALLIAEGGALRVEYYNDNSHLPPALSTLGRQDWHKRMNGIDSCNLNYVPYDIENGRERYLDCYRDAWRQAHGSLRGFDAEGCWRGALYRSTASREALTEARDGENFAGVLSLDERRQAASGVGWISFCYIVPPLRRGRRGIQLIGCAVSRYRALGRRVLRLSVAPSNPAVEFYRWAGFRQVGTEAGAVTPLLVMEKEL